MRHHCAAHAAPLASFPSPVLVECGILTLPAWLSPPAKAPPVMTRIALAIIAVFAGTALADLTVAPGAVTLRGKDARQRLIVTETTAGRVSDRTREATFSTSPSHVAAVSPDGL